MFLKLCWPTVRKNCSSDQEKLWRDEGWRDKLGFSNLQEKFKKIPNPYWHCTVFLLLFFFFWHSVYFSCLLKIHQGTHLVFYFFPVEKVHLFLDGRKTTHDSAFSKRPPWDQKLDNIHICMLNYTKAMTK